MNPLPLLVREFNVALRRRAMRLLRLGFGGGSMVATIWALLVSGGNAGPKVFAAISGIAAVLCMAVAVFAGSDSISRERREGTLGFLFLTDLSARDVVFGKFSAVGLVPVYTLMGMFPALALCPLFGGMTAFAFWRMIAALMLILVFSISAALYVSSFCEDHRKAFGGAAMLLIVANPLWLWHAAANFSAGAVALTFLLFSVAAILLFNGATIRLARHWRDEEVALIPKPKETAREGKANRALLEKFPVGWMMLRRRAGTIWKTTWAMGAAAMGCALLARLAIGPATFVAALWILLAIHIGYELVLLTRTAYAFYTDRKNGALELLLGSPLTNEEIFDGFNTFLLRKSALWAGIITVLDVVMSVLLSLSGRTAVAALPLALALGLWITVFGIGWLGVYRSLMMKHPSLAIPATFARLSFAPVLLSLLFLAVPQTNVMKVAWFYLVSSGFLAVFFAMDAKQALVTHGRTLLLRPESEKPPHIENEWSFIDWEESRAAEKPEFEHLIYRAERVQENPY